jgi:hypothetical protein
MGGRLELCNAGGLSGALAQHSGAPASAQGGNHDKHTLGVGSERPLIINDQLFPLQINWDFQASLRDTSLLWVY